MKTPFLIILLLAYTAMAIAQDYRDPAIWSNIEIAIKNKKNLTVTRNRITQLLPEILQQKDYAALARFYHYRILVDDMRTEDTLYFRNSAFIDSLLYDAGTAEELKTLLHIMQAKRIAVFRHRYMKFKKTSYQTKDLRYNYPVFDNKEMDSIAAYHFNEAKKTARNNTRPVQELLWLSSDPTLFLFRPGLTDIIFADEITYVKAVNSYTSFGEKQIINWMLLPPDGFVSVLDSLSRTDGSSFAVLKAYYSWMKYHRRDTAAFYFIESLARAYLVNNAYYETRGEVGKAYEQYLLGQIHSPYNEVKANGVYELCMLWKERAGGYAPPSYYYSYSYYGKNKENQWDTAYQYLPVKALNLYENNLSLFQHFPHLGNRLFEMKKEILEKKLEWQVSSKTPPGSPLLMKLEYKNVPRIYYRIVKLTNSDAIPSVRQDALRFLQTRSILREKEDALPLPPDHNLHRTFVKIDPLVAGEYAMLLSDHPFYEGDTTLSYQTFTITSIATLHTDNRIYVVNRKTGMPLEGAAVKAYYTQTKKNSKIKDTIYSHYRVNSRGSIDLPGEEKYDLQITYRGDTLEDYADVEKDEIEEEVFNKDDYDDLVDYYDENTTVHILTDRSIYRPGQKVFYKAIFVTKDWKTGRPVIMNEQNLKQGPFKNWLKKWIKEMEPELHFDDPFGRKVDSVKIAPDEYGSMSGYFTIPKTAATGEWEIEADYLEKDDHNNGEFRVEEYKRPTYELTLDPPVKTYHPGDTLSFLIKAKSFAGMKMGNLRIRYSIERRNTLSDIYKSGAFAERIELIDTIGYTDSDGRLMISVPDTSLQKLKQDKDAKITFNYSIEATAIDATGESHEIEGNVKVSTHPVSIRVPLRETIYAREWRPVLVTTKDINGLDISKELSVKVYRTDTTVRTYKSDLSYFADQWIHPAEEWQQWFPYIAFSPSAGEEKKELVYETTIHTAGYEKLRMPEKILLPGKYQLVAACIEDGRTTGTEERTFTVFDTQPDVLPGKRASFFYLPANSMNAGDTLRFFSGSSYDSTYALTQIKYFSSANKKLQIRYLFQEQKKGVGITDWKWKVPEDAAEKILLTQIFVADNEVYRYSEDIRINPFSNDPQIIVKQFRSSLTPGTPATFSVSVQTKDRNVAAELLSTMYDASLDRIEKHKWQLPYPDFRGRLKNEWPSDISSYSRKSYTFNKVYAKPPASSLPEWLVINKGYYTDVEKQPVSNPLLSLQGRVPGLMITGASGFDEVQVIAYGVTTQRFSTGNISKLYSTVSIRGVNSLVGNSKPLIILDGVPYAGDLSSIKMSELTEAVILKDSDATAIYGSRAAQGVLLLSTKGPVVIPEIKPEAPVKIRSNFNETAFFLPAVHADKDGYYYFNFTMPESVTEWNWKIFGHTKKAQFAYAERKLVTKLPLMVQPNMPRLLYQGDKIVLKTRISNTDTLEQKGKVTCKIEDEQTGEDITSLIITNAVNSFTVSANGTTVSPFILTIPTKQLNPLRITVTAQSGETADAEEHIVPVLSTTSLVKESIPFRFLQKDSSIALPVIKGELYGAGISIHPLPQAAIVNALPFLAEYSYDCAEQTFNKLLAHAVAVKIMRTDTSAQQMFKRIKEKTEKDTTAKPPALDEQLTPWLSLANKAKTQQEQLYSLLDTDRSVHRIKDHLQRLYKLQNTDGGLSWFDGGRSNAGISAYVLAGFGRMLKDSLIKSKDVYDYRYDDFIKKLLVYCNQQIAEKIIDPGATYSMMQFVYARSFWLHMFPPSGKLLQDINTFLENKWKTIDNDNLLQQSRIITSTLRYFSSSSHPLHRKALEQLESIRQLAISDENGLRWKDISDANDLSSNAEETLGLLAEAFEEGNSEQVASGILQWLLTTQSEHHWKTTKATAAAVKLLYSTGSTITAATQSVTADINNNVLKVSNDLLNGNSLAFAKTASLPGEVTLKKTAENVAAGSITAYYFVPWDQLRQAGNGIKLSKELLYLHNDQWEPVKEGATLRLGDKVRVVLHIETPRPLQYVYINDNRSAAFEPEDATSGYQYTKTFSYYQSVRDAGCQFFVSSIPAGEQVIRYDLVVAQEGNFSCGPASLECMYRPDVHAWSNALQITTAE